MSSNTPENNSAENAADPTVSLTDTSAGFETMVGSGGDQFHPILVDSKVEELVVAEEPLGAVVEEPFKPILAPYEDLPSVVQSAEIYEDIPKDFRGDGVVLPIPADTVERTNEFLAGSPNIDYTATQEGQVWFDTKNKDQQRRHQ